MLSTAVSIAGKVLSTSFDFNPFSYGEKRLGSNVSVCAMPPAIQSTITVSAGVVTVGSCDRQFGRYPHETVEVRLLLEDEEANGRADVILQAGLFESGGRVEGGESAARDVIDYFRVDRCTDTGFEPRILHLY